MTRHPFRHYLVTRFNVRVPQWRDVDKAGVPTLDDAWIIHRLDLFQRFTVPGVVEQSCDNFHWIVLVDRETPEHFKRELEALPFYEVLYTADWLVDLQKRLSQRGWIVTTRLDNDDTIHPGFIETVQKNITTKQFHFINLCNGYTLHGHTLRPKHHIANPFMTLVEKGPGIKTIYFTPHGRAMQEHGPIVQVSEGRLWTQVIHERNYING